MRNTLQSKRSGITEKVEMEAEIPLSKREINRALILSKSTKRQGGPVVVPWITMVAIWKSNLATLKLQELYIAS
jgi:hypothetical protein